MPNDRKKSGAEKKISKKKVQKRFLHQYSEDDVKNALEAIRSDDMTTSAASREYGVPRTTLIDILKGRVPEISRRMGPAPELTHEEERTLVEWCFYMTKCGYPRKNEDLLNSVQIYMKSTGIYRYNEKSSLRQIFMILFYRQTKQIQRR